MVNLSDRACVAYRCLAEACVFHAPIAEPDPLALELDELFGTVAWPACCPACGGELVRIETEVASCART